MFGISNFRNGFEGIVNEAKACQKRLAQCQEKAEYMLEKLRDIEIGHQ